MSSSAGLPAPSGSDIDSDIPLAERKTVESLLANDCRWPFGDPLARGFHFCGRPKKDGSPYCEAHSRLGLQAAKPRMAVYRPQGPQ